MNNGFGMNGVGMGWNGSVGLNPMMSFMNGMPNPMMGGFANMMSESASISRPN